MNKIATFASLLAGLTGIGLGHLYFERLEAEVSGGPKLSVVVAAEDIATGSLLDKDMLAIREIPQAYVEQRHIRAPDLRKVLGARVSQGVHVNEAVLYSDLAQYSQRPRVLSNLIQEGMRAAVVDANNTRFDGLLEPGDRVDLLLTTEASLEKSKTVTLLQNLMVLSVGGDIGSSQATRSERGARFKTGGAGAVTLSVTTEQAQVITQAKATGQLTLTLRNPDDIQLVEGLEETTRQEVARAKERIDWHVRPKREQKVIEHVR